MIKVCTRSIIAFILSFGMTMPTIAAKYCVVEIATDGLTVLSVDLPEIDKPWLGKTQVLQHAPLDPVSPSGKWDLADAAFSKQLSELIIEARPAGDRGRFGQGCFVTGPLSNVENTPEALTSLAVANAQIRMLTSDQRLTYALRSMISASTQGQRQESILVTLDQSMSAISYQADNATISSFALPTLAVIKRQANGNQNRDLGEAVDRILDGDFKNRLRDEIVARPFVGGRQAIYIQGEMAYPLATFLRPKWFSESWADFSLSDIAALKDRLKGKQWNRVQMHRMSLREREIANSEIDKILEKYNKTDLLVATAALEKIAESINRDGRIFFYRQGHWAPAFVADELLKESAPPPPKVKIIETASIQHQLDDLLDKGIKEKLENANAALQLGTCHIQNRSVISDSATRQERSATYLCELKPLGIGFFTQQRRYQIQGRAELAGNNWSYSVANPMEILTPAGP